MYNFPASPVIDQVYTPPGGSSYKWNGYGWAQLAAEGSGSDASDMLVIASGGGPVDELADWMAQLAGNTPMLFAGTYSDGSAASGGTAPAETVKPMRFSGMAFIGSGFDSQYTTYANTVGQGTWIKTTVDEDLRYLEKGAQLRVGSQVGGTAVLAFSRQSDNDQLATDATVIGTADFVHNDIAGTRSVWGSYIEAQRIAGAGPALGMEIEVVSRGNDTVPLTPYGSLGGGSPRTLAYGMNIGSGGDSATIGYTSYDAGNAINIVGNPSRFKAGLTFLYTALTRATPGDETTPAIAIQLAQGHQIVGRYGNGANAIGGLIRFDGNDATTQSRIVFAGNSFRIKNVRSDLVTEDDLLAISSPTMAAGQVMDRFAFIPAAVASGNTFGTVTLAAAGGSTNISILLSPTGVGNVQTARTFHAASASAIPAGGTAGLGFRVSSTSNFGTFFGSGAPTLAAAKGSLYLRSDGASNSSTYVNTNGSTTWVPLLDTASGGGGEPPITIGTTSQYWRGDKSWQTLDKAAVGLGNVDNTSDANAPVSTAQAAADALRVLKAGDTMTGKLTLPISTTTNAGFNLGNGASPSTPVDGDVWAVGGILVLRAASTNISFINNVHDQTMFGIKTFGGKTIMRVPVAGAASTNLPHGVAPTTPVNGDMWTTTAGLFIYINGAVKTVTLT